MIRQVSLLDVFENSRTFHIVYQHRKEFNKREVSKIREKILEALKSNLKAKLKNKNYGAGVGAGVKTGVTVGDRLSVGVGEELDSED